MPLDKLHDIYTLDTSAFYTDEELKIDMKLNKSRRILKNIKNKYENNEYTEFYYEKHIKILNNIINDFKQNLKNELKNNIDITRVVKQEHIIPKNIISIFDSNLTRSLGMKIDNLNLELLVIRVYYFDIMKSIINNGFLLNGDKYLFFSASAGQIRTKKFVAIKEDSFKKSYNNLTCGLSIEKINKLGGVNTNKYLAYLSLCNSATDVWIDFDIDKSIVVEDMETLVNGEVDFIDVKNEFNIERKFMDIPITHTDGCGMINYGDKNFMCRAPWIKGLLSPFRFHDFIKENNGNPIIRDIYGKEYNIIEDDIQIIFTKSQFKMWKYFIDWNEYKNSFKKYNCTFGICNEEDTFNDTVLNYQMLQTLTDISEEEIKYICKNTKNKIQRLSSDVETMLKVFGVHKNNHKKNYFQQCLEIYPELLKDIYTKESLRSIKNSLEKKAWSGKLDIYGKYTFIIPDLYAFCEYLFLDHKNPKGLINDGEVYCKLFKNSTKLDCLRSPHLYKEHAVRNNVVKLKRDIGKWFITNGVYVSSHDLISKLLQFDNDGDKSLVIGDKKFIEIAERNMNNIVPLYYEMGKSNNKELNNENIYKGMITAFTEGNIGGKSNDITKIWNNENINLDIIKILCSLVNFKIDMAKTLYKPDVPKELEKTIKKYTKNKLPHFFIYAKDKQEDQVEDVNDYIVDKILKYIPKQRLNFRNKTMGDFNYKILMHNHNVEENDKYNDIINKYKQLTKNIKFYMTIDDIDYTKNNFNFIFKEIRKELLKVNNDEYYLVDCLIYYLFFKRKNKFKYVFWQCFGDIVLENIKNNMEEDYVYCNRCGKRFFREHFNEYLCNNCKKYKKIEEKIIVCTDCGEKFEVNNKVNNKYRCDECQKKHIRKIKTQKQKKYRL